MPRTKTIRKSGDAFRIRWAVVVAVTALLFSFLLWTWILLLRVAEHDVPHIPQALLLGDRDAIPLVPFSAPPAPAEPAAGVEHAPAPDDAVHGEYELAQWQLHSFATLWIPAIGVRAPVLLPNRTFWDSRQWQMLEEQMQAGLAHGTVAYPHSVLPGSVGSLIVAGHSSPPSLRAEQSAYGHLFRRLPELTEGDIVTVIHGGKAVRYAVRGTTVVAATDTHILAQQSGESLLILITCYPVGTTKDRLVVTAVRVDEGGE